MKMVNTVFFVFVFIVATWCNVSAEESKNSEDFTALFPSPLKGWEASEVTVEKQEALISFNELNLLFGDKVPERLILTRTYYSQRDGGKVTIQLDTENVEKSTYIESVQSLSPEEAKSLEKDGFIKFNYQSYHGIKALDNEKHTVMIILEIQPSRIFEIDVDTFGKNKGIVMEFLKKADIQKISAFMEEWY